MKNNCAQHTILHYIVVQLYKMENTDNNKVEIINPSHPTQEEEEVVAVGQPDNRRNPAEVTVTESDSAPTEILDLSKPKSDAKTSTASGPNTIISVSTATVRNILIPSRRVPPKIQPKPSKENINPGVISHSESGIQPHVGRTCASLFGTNTPGSAETIPKMIMPHKQFPIYNYENICRGVITHDSPDHLPIVDMNHASSSRRNTPASNRQRIAIPSVQIPYQKSLIKPNNQIGRGVITHDNPPTPSTSIRALRKHNRGRGRGVSTRDISMQNCRFVFKSDVPENQLNSQSTPKLHIPATTGSMRPIIHEPVRQTPVRGGLQQHLGNRPTTLSRGQNCQFNSSVNNPARTGTNQPVFINQPQQLVQMEVPQVNCQNVSQGVISHVIPISPPVTTARETINLPRPRSHFNQNTPANSGINIPMTTETIRQIFLQQPQELGQMEVSRTKSQNIGQCVVTQVIPINQPVMTPREIITMARPRSSFNQTVPNSRRNISNNNSTNRESVMPQPPASSANQPNIGGGAITKIIPIGQLAKAPRTIGLTNPRLNFDRNCPPFCARATPVNSGTINQRIAPGRGSLPMRTPRPNYQNIRRRTVTQEDQPINQPGIISQSPVSFAKPTSSSHVVPDFRGIHRQRIRCRGGRESREGRGRKHFPKDTLSPFVPTSPICEPAQELQLNERSLVRNDDPMVSSSAQSGESDLQPIMDNIPQNPFMYKDLPEAVAYLSAAVSYELGMDNDTDLNATNTPNTQVVDEDNEQYKKNLARMHDDIGKFLDYFIGVTGGLPPEGVSLSPSSLDEYDDQPPEVIHDVDNVDNYN